MENKELQKENLFQTYYRIKPTDYETMKIKVFYLYDKIKEIENDMDIPVLIDDLDISLRSWNVLKMAKINTIVELQQYSEPQLLKFRLLGKKSVWEIVQELKKYGLTLKQ